MRWTGHKPRRELITPIGHRFCPDCDCLCPHQWVLYEAFSPEQVALWWQRECSICEGTEW